MSPLLCKASPHISCHFILAAAQQVHVVVPIIQIRHAKLREVKGFIQGHCGGYRNFGIQLKMFGCRSPGNMLAKIVWKIT